MEQALIGIWLIVWAAITVFSACVIGNIENVRGSGVRDFPTFIFPLLFGWAWPALLCFMIICSPLAWLSDRATKKDLSQ